MGRTLQLPDDVYRALEAYANERRQSPEEAIAAWLRDIQRRAERQGEEAERAPTSEMGDPWEGFYAAFESPYPDLTERHDYYIGQAALDPHAETREAARERANDDREA
jgi:hypothetical protein